MKKATLCIAISLLITIVAFVIFVVIQMDKNKPKIESIEGVVSGISTVQFRVGDVVVLGDSGSLKLAKATDDNDTIGIVTSVLKIDTIKPKFIDLPETLLNSGYAFNEDTTFFICNYSELVRYTEDTVLFIFLDEFEKYYNKDLKLNFLVYSKGENFELYLLRVIAAYRIEYKNNYLSLTFSIDTGKKIGLMIFSSDNNYTLLPKPGTELTVDLNGTSITIPVVGGKDAFEKAIK